MGEERSDEREPTDASHPQKSLEPEIGEGFVPPEPSMGEERSDEREPTDASHPHFLEVTCVRSRKVRRFAAGTEAGFAVYLINRQSGIRVPVATHIEAVKEGEEPVSFGPSALLVNYGKEWKLQTVMEEGYQEAKKIDKVSVMSRSVQKPTGILPAEKASSGSGTNIRFQYIGKVFVAFAFIFLLAVTLGVFLENLPGLMEFAMSSF